MTDTALFDKGGRMEEVLREYFLEQGYFVVRGAKYTVDEFEITDIDLWLYQRTSSFSRQRFNVDIKNKRTPQALERILWAKGVQTCLRLDGALVATTDTRSTLKRFGDANSVIVLDGTLLSKLKHRYANATRRISEEELAALARGDKGDKLGVGWVQRLAATKSRVLTQLDFDGCNSILNDIRYFAEQVLTVRNRAQVACRLFYLSTALALITLDFILRDFSFDERKSQSDHLNDGLRFGTLGKQGAERVFATAAKIASAYLRDGNVRSAELVKHLRSEAMKLPVEILTEFVLKTNSGKALFDLARSFEAQAFAKHFQAPAEMPVDSRAVIGAALDFHQIDRKAFFDILVNSTSPKPEPATATTGHPQQQLEILADVKTPKS